jgi:tetratricopeptide (TPR) repeat protein/tRNA A-37 threonylcarbamoyl transferase component Bud32
MHCPHCGTAAPAGVSLCPNCRGSLGDSALTVAFPADALAGNASTQVIGDPAMTRAGSDTAETAMPGVVLAAGESGPLQPGQSFGPRYHIIRLLGAGGMGAVYQAWDAELGVAVAIKVIRPEAMADATIAADIERRFKRELLLARQVTHKNVVRIHDIGQIDGVKYITMSYVDGVDLATVVKREGRLPIERVLTIARSVGSGLAAAHAAGVVHRDLKPANIMFQTDGHALIMDFGIARSTGDVGRESTAASVAPGHLARAARADATMAGVIVGTVEYMAPEQASGGAIDQRADVYAFGLILYDLLTGKARAHPEGPVAELQARIQQAPPPIKTIVQDVPDALARIVMRCIDPKPAARYQSAAEIVAELDHLDARGALIPVKRTVRLPLVVALALFLLMVSGLTWWLSRSAAPPAPHDPVSVVIADFDNTTNEPAFDLALEQTVRRGLEDASFISAFDRSRIRGALNEVPPDTFDETAARALAVKAGLGVVLAGSIGPRGNGFDILIKASRAITGNEILEARGRAANRDDVVGVATQLVARVRRALGDEMSDSEQLLAMRSVSTTSLEVVSHYARAMDSQSRGQYEEARQAFLRALDLDPEFGLGYQALAVIARNLGRLQEANTYISEALRHLTGMTERERFVTRGFQFRLSGDYKQCANEFGEMTARFAADPIAFNQRALCSSKLRDLRQAVAEMQRALKILPNHTIFRGNLAIYTAYAGDFAAAEQEARSVQQPSDLATLATAFSQIGQGQRPAALDTYQHLSSLSPRGASWAASGRADLALFEGRFAEAASLYEEGAEADLAGKNPDRAARKLTSLAYARLQQGRAPAAVQAAERALANSSVAEVRFLAARALVEGGAIARAKAVADALAAEFPAEPQAYGKILQGQLALKNGDPRAAIKILTEANEVLNTWIGHFELGRAYFEAGALAQADSEFDRCIERRGEALSLLVDEEPTYGYLPIVYYYQGRVREGLRNARFADSYREYLAIRGASADDPLLPEVRKRAGAN